MSISIRNDDAALRTWTSYNASDGTVTNREDGGARAWKNDGVSQGAGGGLFKITTTASYQEASEGELPDYFVFTPSPYTSDEIFDKFDEGFLPVLIVNGALGLEDEELEIVFVYTGKSNGELALFATQFADSVLTLYVNKYKAIDIYRGIESETPTHVTMPDTPDPGNASEV